MSRDITNKVVVITGGAEGIGFLIADMFLSKGAKTVVILDINEELGVEAASKLNAKYGDHKAEFHKCDVTTDLDIVSKKIFAKYSAVDVLVNSAGIGNESDIEKVIGINLNALIIWSYKFHEHMRTDKGGKGGTIINLGSIYSYRNDPFGPIYKATKHGVKGFSASFGHPHNYKISGVRVLCLCPGFTETSFLKINNVTQVLKDFSEFLKDTPFQPPEAVARAANVIFETAETGTVWEIEGGAPVKQIV